MKILSKKELRKIVENTILNEKVKINKLALLNPLDSLRSLIMNLLSAGNNMERIKKSIDGLVKYYNGASVNEIIDALEVLLNDSKGLVDFISKIPGIELNPINPDSVSSLTSVLSWDYDVDAERLDKLTKSIQEIALLLAENMPKEKRNAAIKAAKEIHKQSEW